MDDTTPNGTPPPNYVTPTKEQRVNDGATDGPPNILNFILNGTPPPATEERGTGEEDGTAPTTKRSREQACLGNDVNGDGKTGTPKIDLDNNGTGDATMGGTEEVPKDGEKETEAKNNQFGRIG